MYSLSIIFTKFGKFGPFLLYAVASCLLWHKKTSFYYYQVGFFTCEILNLVLKGTFKQPRPSEDTAEYFRYAFRSFSIGAIYNRICLSLLERC